MGVHSDARPRMTRKREWSGKVIQFENVGLRYGLGPEVLSDLTFDVHPNSFQFLTGPSGAGKTSLLRLMLMSLKPTRGVVRLFGREAAPSCPPCAARSAWCSRISGFSAI